jgi:DNA helicase-2/ATP-dependent DNA helicase PcrA
MYAAYQERLRRTGNADFADLIGLPLALLRAEPAVRDRLRQRFPAILVDEYQDSNAAQFELLKELYAPTTHLCAVGDDDQSIYRFRARTSQHPDLPESFPGTKIVRLERNYRSRGPILEAAHSVVSHNLGRLGKELIPTRPGGRAPFIVSLGSQEEEAEWCAKRAMKHARSGGRWSDVAILYRTNAQSLAFETALTRLSIPFKIVGSLKFYEREEIKDVLAWLSFLANPRDSVSFARVLNKPARGIGQASQKRILDALSGSLSDCTEASRRALGALPSKASAGLRSFLSLYEGFQSALDGGLPLFDLVTRIAGETGLLDYHRGQDEIAGSQRAANIEELANSASAYPGGREGLSSFLEAIALDRSRMEEGAAADALTLITMHNTKGLEFPVVMVTGLEQGLFPRADDDQDEIEEQRRLFYVAITRAMDELDFTWARSRRIRGRLEAMSPSMFLYELPDSMRVGLDGAPGRTAIGADGWKAGQTVYHEDYGSGSIIQVKSGGDGLTLLVVLFDSGLSMRFVPRYDRKLEKVSH